MAGAILASLIDSIEILVELGKILGAMGKLSAFSLLLLQVGFEKLVE
jgi:hypothetical protein